MEEDIEQEDAPVLTSAQQIERLTLVEKARFSKLGRPSESHSFAKDITRLLRLASSSLALLSLPQTDEVDGTQSLAQGDERSETFTSHVTEYFATLDVSPRLTDS